MPYLKAFGGELRFGNVTPFQICFSLLSFPTLLKNMFYNYLIFSMVALSLRIFKKHFVSVRRNFSFTAMKQKFHHSETIQRKGSEVSVPQYWVTAL